MNFKTGFLITILAFGFSSFASAADKVDMNDPNLAMYQDGQSVDHVDTNAGPKPPGCKCDQNDSPMRAATQPGQTNGSDGGSGAKGIDQ